MISHDSYHTGTVYADIALIKVSSERPTTPSILSQDILTHIQLKLVISYGYFWSRGRRSLYRATIFWHMSGSISSYRMSIFRIPTSGHLATTSSPRVFQKGPSSQMMVQSAQLRAGVRRMEIENYWIKQRFQNSTGKRARNCSIMLWLIGSYQPSF